MSDREYDDVFAALAAPFDRSQIKSRVGSGGKSFDYLTARLVMNRLDDVLGPMNWWDEYHQAGDNAVLCKLTIKMPEGDMVTKQDVGGYAGMQDQGEDEKSGFSDAFKRAAVKFGVGRYLYKEGVPAFAQSQFTDGQGTPERSSGGQSNGEPTTSRQMYPWLKKLEEQHRQSIVKPIDAWARQKGLPYKMTEWSDEEVAQAVAQVKSMLGGTPARTERPQNGSSGAPERPRSNQPAQAPERAQGGNGRPWSPPRTGRGLFAWIKDQEKIHSRAILGPVNDYGNSLGLPARMVDWDDSEIPGAFFEACKLLGIDARTGQKEDNSVEGLRVRFNDIFAELAARDYGPEANPNQFWLAVDGVCDAAQLPRITSVNSLNDAEEIKRYIAAAEEALATPF